MAHLSRHSTRSLASKSSTILVSRQPTSTLPLLNNIKQFRSLSLSNRSLHIKHTVDRVGSSPSVFTRSQQRVHTVPSQRNFSKFQNVSWSNARRQSPIRLSTARFAASSSQKKDYYETLGVDRNAKDADVKKAFYKLAKQWHPDANKAPEAKDKFSEINEAYQVLSNKDKRAQYDRFGHEMPGMGGMGGHGFNPQDMPNLNDLFENLFGGRGGGGGGFPFGDMFGGGQEAHDPLAPERGRDVQIDVPLTFMEAVNGCKRDLKVQRFDECTACASSGVEAGTHPTKCTTCDGKGRMTQSSGFMVIQQSCWDCNGVGQKHSNCRQCQGSGLKSAVSSIDVNIPAGVDDGTRVRIAGQGHSGRNKGGRGHCWLMCRVRADERFERNGSDVHVAVDVPAHTAILGGTVSVPTLSGEAEVRVKAGTQPEHREIMRSKGITEPSTGRKGHQYLHFNVVIPTQLTDEQRDLMQQFADSLERGGEQH